MYEYDDDGRLIRSETTTEPEWDEQERTWMLALAEYEDTELCPVCGGPKSICQAPEAEGGFDVPAPSRCHVATAIAQARKALDEKHPQHPQALTFHAVRKAR